MQEAMRGLAQGIVASHEARATGLASIRQDVSAHRERTQVHVHGLEGARRVASRALHSHLAGGRAGLRAGVGAQLRELDHTHNAMAHQQGEDLAKGPLRLRASVGAQLRELDHTHNAMAHQQREDLARGHAGLRAGVSTQLQELDQAHNAMAQQQRDDLAQATAQRRSEIVSWLGELTAERLAAGQEWGQIATALRGRRAGVIAPEAPAPMPTKEQAAALRDRVFAYLADHPDGVRFLEIEQQFRLDSQQASSVLTSLVEDGKAKRSGRLYLAA